MTKLAAEIKKHMTKVIAVILVAVVIVLLLERYSSWLFTQMPDLLGELFRQGGYWSPVLFVAFYVVANIFLAPSYPFLFVSGMMYGLLVGSVLALIAEVLSATANFYIGRYIQHKFFKKLSRHPKVKFVKSYVEKRGFGIVLLLRYLGFYFDLVSYAAGMTKIRYRPFILATFMGFIPYILIYVNAGRQLMNVRSGSFIFSILLLKLALFAVFLKGYLVYRLWKKKHS